MMAISLPDVLLGCVFGIVMDRTIIAFNKSAKQQGFIKTIKNWWGL